MEKGFLTAKVAVEAAVVSIDRPWSYLVPETLGEAVLPGTRVIVPFGRGNRRSEGIVLGVERVEEKRELKCIERVLDAEPVFTEDDLKLAVWMRERYFCTLYDAARAMLPAGMWFTGGRQRVADKTERFAKLIIPGEEAAEQAARLRRKAPKQAAVLDLLSQVGEAAAGDICEFTGVAPTVLKSLEEKELISFELRELLRRPVRISDEEPESVALTDEQQTAFEGLLERLKRPTAEAALLYGVTGSGKTSIYIRLCQEALGMGRSAIVLVPEISLTPQLVGIFSRYFGDAVAVIHSSLTMGERVDEWKRIKRGGVRVVIGTRSAIFAPLSDIGLIVVDEEQEHTYKSENSPRYHARDVAKYRCVHSNALLVLGSATPSLESMYAARSGRYALYELHGRYNERPLPEVIVADMREELKCGNAGTIGAVLREELSKNIERGEQSILFLNRRGASGLVVCGECGHTFTCRNCSVSMTWHSVGKRLRCHYCGWSQPISERCPECGGRLKFLNAGTQRVEEELRELFPDAGVVRMDADSVSRAGSHEALLDKFKTRSVPILLGTQMVTKGLDFENVTLVGVISADQLLYSGDFRAGERAFSLICQVVGRSGRGDKTGRAVLQTFTPENELLTLAAKQDYMAFYEKELRLRGVQSAPPISDMIAVTVTGEEEGAVLRGCMRLRELLEGARSRDIRGVLGPAPAGVTRVNNRYRYRLTVTCRNSRAVRDIVRGAMGGFARDSGSRGLSVYADADPIY